MSSHHVPDFEVDEDYSIPASSSSGLTRPKNSTMVEEEMMELLWQNGQVIIQSQNPRRYKRPHTSTDEPIILRSDEQTTINTTTTTTPHHPNHHLFIQEDEMASWLHYPLEDDSSFDRDIYADLFSPPPPPPPPPPPLPRPPIPPTKRADVEGTTRFQNFMHFTRPKGRVDSSGPSSSNKSVRESTVVDSNETTCDGKGCEGDVVVRCGSIGAAGTSTVTRELGTTTTCDVTMTSSSHNSGTTASASAEPVNKTTTEKEDDRKRKGREAEDTECYSEDVEFESTDAKKQVGGSTSTKRSRAAEVHNLSERRRRDRINEKMKALQELIPRCNKSDKASMLDEAIEYLKSLQLQVQMMSMGCNMVPMFFPGVQYMPPMGMGMGMGMSMEMGMNRPMVPFPSVLPGSTLLTPAGAAHLGPRFPMPAFPVPPVPVSDPSRIQAPNQSDPMSFAPHNPNQPRIPNFADPYQRYLGLHQMQVPLPQNQVVVQPGKPSNSKDVGSPENCRKDVGHPENHQSG